MLLCKNLRCEYLENPIGLDEPRPRFRWILESDQRETVQTAYQLTVGDWDSGRVESSDSIDIEYAGPPLSPFTRYDVSVQVWDNHGSCSHAEGFFETGLLDPTNWSAKWICAQEKENEICPMLRKTIPLAGPVRSARIYATAYGLYEITIGGRRVGDAYLTPGFTSYDKQLLYQTYDVTDLLRSSNVLCVTLGKGWCCGRFPFGSNDNPYHSNANPYHCPPALLLQLRVTYEDGRCDTFGTDASWRWTDSPVRFSQIYDGETYDATMECPAIYHSDYDDRHLPCVTLAAHPFSHIRAQQHEPVKIMDRISPVQLIHTPKGETVIDFGQNMVGWASFTVRGPRGGRVRLSHAEVLDKEGNFYTENMRSAKNRIEYILSGNGEETYHPHFTFQGFRYVRVDEYPGTVKLEDFVGLVIHSAMERTGDFSCSDPEINQLYHNALWGQKGNFVDVPTDCPQRDERLGWTGDAQVFIRTAVLNMNAAAFYTKWLRDLALDQTLENGVPIVVPRFSMTICSSAWGDAATICPWELYLAFGDTRILQRQYESMKQWVAYIRAQGEDEFLWNTGHHYGDWLAMDAKEGDYVGATSKDYIATVFYAHSTYLTAKTARVLGYEQEAAQYETLYQNILSAFRKEFVTPNGRLSENTQTAYVLALQFHMVENEKRIADHLAQMVRENGCRLTTGFVGTPYLCHVLSQHGYPDLAAALLVQKEYPSWLYSVRQGATTIWEHWDGIRPDGSFWSADMNSYNHYAYGSIVDWMYTVLAGINYQEEAPGYKKIRFAPLVCDEFSFVEASIQTPYGKAALRWEKKEGGISYQISVPANTSATFVYPDGKSVSFGSGTYCL